VLIKNRHGAGSGKPKQEEMEMKIKAMGMGIVVLALVASAHAELIFEDNFNRDNTTANTSANVSIGENYELVQQSTSSFDATAKITSNKVGIGQLGANANNVSLLYKGLSLGNTAFSGNSFSISGNITTVGFNNSGLYGLTFNHQDDGSFYAARIQNNSTTALQFVRSDKGGAVTGFANIANTVVLDKGSTYFLKIDSSSPGVFSYTLTGASLDNGGTLSGTVTDTILQLNGGYAGFYNSFGNTGPRFDDLSITVIPEPATLGLFSVSAAGLMLMRRLML
jgi:hypothetical protein